MSSSAGTDQQSTNPPRRDDTRFPIEIWILVICGFIIAVGFGILAPALPTFAASFDVGVTAVSLTVSAFAFMRLLFAPTSGRLVTRWGERKVYFWGLIIVAVGTAVCGFATEYWQLLLFRSIGGIGSTMFTVSGVAMLIRLAPPAMRGRASGLWATSFLLGNITGPLIGGGLVEISIRLPFLVYGVAVLLAAFVSLIFLRNSTLADRGNDDADVTPLRVRDALRHPTYRAALASNFGNGWAVFGVRISLLPLFVVEVLRERESMAGISLAVFAAGNAIALTFSGRLADRIGRKPLALAGLLVSGGGTVWLGFTDSVTMFLIASVVAGIGSGLLSPPQSAVVADIIGNKGKGGPVLAGFQMAADVGAIIGPLVAGLLADSFSYGAAFGVTGLITLLAVFFWVPAPETLPRPVTTADEEPGTATELAPESGILSEAPEPPVGERVGGKPDQPDV
ncbi:MFS transporter [Actinoalloteichus hymeniacidonis]|uniref:Arabinose efflux permease family protein n=1 Tax=Actinoalloteichus hymeniacidonis TaxID=340345 RepID=A0AAC9MX44_9PSEU|nr:MFS transporter [Actinoalloteichus hymeniacidonis]AOS61859.1 arabinose efflux permease family protein [Actinoalloteichus hymeniacidonis]MBB5910121.1 MFS family permease [Actinoalloteichus hymeniacidonis]